MEQKHSNPWTTVLDGDRKSKGKEDTAKRGLTYAKYIPEPIPYQWVPRDDSKLSQNEVGFLHIGTSVPTYSYDVEGEWKLLYKKPGDDGDDKDNAAQGPMSPEPTKKPAPRKSVTKSTEDAPRSAPPTPVPKEQPSPYIFEPKGPGIKPRPPKGETTAPPPKQKSLPLTSFEPKGPGIKPRPPKEETRAPSPRQKLSPDITFEPKGPGIKPRPPKEVPSPPSPTKPPNPVSAQTVPPSPKPPPPMKINVLTPEGKTIPLVVEPKNTIDDIKDMVQDKERIPKDHQRLLDPRNKPLEDNQKTLDDCSIKNGDTLILEPMQIHVRTPDRRRTITLNPVTPDDTIADVKDRVQKLLNGIPLEEIRPTFKGRSLPHGSTLRENWIKHNDMLDLEPMEIYVREPDGEKHTLAVDPTDSIDKIKEQVLDKTGIPKMMQRLTFNKRPLEKDTMNLRDCGIKHQDTLDLQPMEITIRTPNGDIVNLQVSPNDAISDIKNQVKDKKGIPLDEQHPKFKGKALPDTSTLDDNGIKHGDTIDLEPMEIYVREPNGKKHTLPVDPTETVDEVKDKVLDKTGIPKKDQRLYFKGQPLDKNNKTLRNCGIKHQDVLDLQPMEIKVKTPNGDIVKLEVNPDDRIEDVKDQVKDKKGIPLDEQHPKFKGKALPDNSTLDDNGIKHGDTIDFKPMEIYVREPNGKKHTLPVDPTETVDEVKDKVLEKTGIPKKDQWLYFKGQPLDKNNKTLRNCGIKHQDVLDLQPMEIKVKTPNGDIVKLEVNPDDRIEDVKDRVKEEKGIPMDEQRPEFNGKLLPDHSTLADNSIKHGDTIDLQPMEIYVCEPHGKKHRLPVDPSETISEIKDKVLDETGIPKKHQHLTFKGSPLDEDSMTLRDCGVKHLDTLDLQPMEIKVRTPNGDIFTLEVSPDDKIKDIKDQVQVEKGIPVDEQRLNFKGQPLADNSSLSDNGIKHGDTINMEPMEIYVQEPNNGNKHTLQVDPSETINTIKNKVVVKTGMPKKDQRLTFKGQPLDDNTKTLQDCGIKHKDTLIMQPMEIKVKTPKGDIVKLDVHPNDTINSIKDRVNQEKGIPVDEQRPTFEGKPLPDQSTLDDNGIRHGDTITLEPMEIHVVDLDGKKHTYTVNLSDKIGTIKSRVEGDTGVPHVKQRLTFEGMLLENDRDTLRDCGIQHQDTLKLEPFYVHVRTPDGKTITLDVTPDSTVGDVKDMVEERENIPFKDQTILFYGMKLEDPAMTLDDAGVRHDDTLDLQLPPPPPKPMVVRNSAPTSSPKKGSYLPETWKQERDRYGEVVERTWKTRYDVEPDESFIAGKISEIKTVFKVEKPVRRSEQKKSQMEGQNEG